MVTVVAGPVLIVSRFVAALGSFGGPGSTPVADVLIPVAAFASFLGGAGAIAFGGRWWTGVLCASPGLLHLLAQLLARGGDPLTNLVFLMQLASPVAAIIGVGFALAHANGKDYSTDEAIDDDEGSAEEELTEDDRA